VSSAARTLPGWDGGADWFMKWCGTRQHLLTTSETVPTAPNAPHQHTCRIDTRRMYAGAVLGSNSGFLAEWDTGTDAWVSQSIVMSSTRLAAVGHTGRTWPVWRDVCVFGPMVWSMLTRVREGMGRVLQWCPGEGVCSTVPAHLKGGAGRAAPRRAAERAGREGECGGRCEGGDGVRGTRACAGGAAPARRGAREGGDGAAEPGHWTAVPG